ncbi:multidrug efflux SMR transporter [Herbaspirillum sp. SJZ099]|uniref:DMT family transporter n=1 Tax=Herbaspirillum sp. SJZ099 TaxID=2572916 RepID=UPI00119FDD92|nr:SMR family transporter [Herbaspirillum sp. SJZ099]
MTLSIAIIVKVIATTVLKSLNDFSRAFSGFRCWGICHSFYCLSHALKPIGAAYAIWAGGGVLITLAARFSHKQKLDAYVMSGIALNVIDVLIINIFSKGISR